MAPSVLGLGIPATSPLTPEDRREALKAALVHMETDMNASAYDWEMLYFTPDMDVSVLAKKLHEKKWDIVMVGMGLRLIPPLLPFFEKIVNIVHEELPTAKFAFNATIEGTREACNRVLPESEA